MQMSIHPRFPPIATDLWIGRGLLQDAVLPRLINRWGHSAVIVAAPAVAKLYGVTLASHCKANLIIMPDSSAHKTRAMKEWLENKLFAQKYGRDTVMIALGGGEIVDLVGFVASTYLRGVPLILVPTTLLAIVDAAIGGKTGIDTPHGKNLLGSYYPPKAIVSDLDTLRSLPEAEWKNGLTEILKAALIADASLWELCNWDWRANLIPLVQKAAQVKIDTIVHDPCEKGLRRILNFGHTVAHALEATSGYAIAHGEAVAVGLMAESYLSLRLGLLKTSDFEDIAAKIEGFGFPLELPSNYDPRTFLEAMKYDKKTAKGTVRFTLLEKIGKAAPFNGEYCSPVAREDIWDMTRWMEEQFQKNRLVSNINKYDS